MWVIAIFLIIQIAAFVNNISPDKNSTENNVYKKYSISNFLGNLEDIKYKLYAKRTNESTEENVQKMSEAKVQAWKCQASKDKCAIDNNSKYKDPVENKKYHQFILSKINVVIDDFLSLLPVKKTVSYAIGFCLVAPFLAIYNQLLYQHISKRKPLPSNFTIPLKDIIYFCIYLVISSIILYYLYNLFKAFYIWGIFDL